MNVRKWKDRIIRKFCIYTWEFWEKFGVHVIPNHFYWPVQDTKLLNKYNFDAVFPTDGIDLDQNKMRDLLLRISKYSQEYAPIHNESGYSSNGDGAILYGMIREIKPEKVIEVGSGYSTVLINHASNINQKEGCKKSEIISIEPYPKPVLRELVSCSNSIRLIENKVEDVSNDVFLNLKDGDVLFIDSSHVVDIGNDVHYLYLHILPRIPVGVFIHIHDIRYPYEYPKEWVIKARKHWAEQYLLQMFLSYNKNYEIVFASNYMFQTNKALMSQSLVGLQLNDGGWPGSFWIRRTE